VTGVMADLEKSFWVHPVHIFQVVSKHTSVNIRQNQIYSNNNQSVEKIDFIDSNSISINVSDCNWINCSIRKRKKKSPDMPGVCWLSESISERICSSRIRRQI